MKVVFTIIIAISFSWMTSIQARGVTNEGDDDPKTTKYESNWSSLRQHNTPQWLEDMKFGIYFHWGPPTIMKVKGNENLTRIEAMDKWTGEKFSAKEWVDLMQRAGAEFGGPVSWHASMNWDSKYTDWTSAKSGPKIDLCKEIFSELRKRDMKIVSTLHATGPGSVFGTVSSRDSTYIDPKVRVQREITPEEALMEARNSTSWLYGLYERYIENMDLFKPDMLWVDTGFGGSVYLELNGWIKNGKYTPTKEGIFISGVREDFAQYIVSTYYNKAQEWGKEVEFIYKTNDIPPGIGMRDIENGNLNGLQYDPWMADINLPYIYYLGAHWFYDERNPFKDANLLIDLTVDIVSKNGRVLLNVPPMADGTFSKEVRSILYAMGDWFEINGEAIYGTSPWVLYGEGPAEIIHEGQHGHEYNLGRDIPEYSGEDIRFTVKENTIYAISLDWPGEKMCIKTLGAYGKLYPCEIKAISMLGSNEVLKWEQTPEGLIVDMPSQKPCDFAYCLKIEKNDLIEKYLSK